MTPSQSEGLDGCEQPQGLPRLKFNHSLELAVLVRSSGIKLFLISDVLPNLFLLKSNGRDRIASCPKLLPIKIPFPCSKLPSHRNCRFPLEVSNHLSNGGTLGESVLTYARDLAPCAPLIFGSCVEKPTREIQGPEISTCTVRLGSFRHKLES